MNYSIFYPWIQNFANKTAAYLFIHRWLLTLCPTSSKCPVLCNRLFHGSWQKNKIPSGCITEFIITLDHFHEHYLPPRPGVYWPSGHWTTLGSRPCSRTHQHHSTERSGWSGTHLRLSRCPSAGTWGTAWKAQPHRARRGRCWSIWTWAPSLVPNRIPGRHKLGCHTCRAKWHCAQRGQWLWRCWKTLRRTSMTLVKLGDTMQTAVVILKCEARECTNPPPHTHTLTPPLLHPQALYKYKKTKKHRISTHLGSRLRGENNKDHACV